MKFIIQTPQKAMKAFSKQKPLRSDIDNFKKHLISLLDKINIIEKRPTDESEEHLKIDLRDFLLNTYYLNTNAVNTKDKKDLVIHLDKTTNSEVGVIIEAKRPTNINEMVTADNPNKKALHELILYYLDERNNAGNFQLKQLVITNINQWYIIDANHFDKHIYNNSKIKTLYKTKINDNKNNPWFYDEVSRIVATLNIDIPCVYFDIKEYNTILRNDKKEDDKQLGALYKILSAQHLLKLEKPNDSNSLNEKFYKELLHIIGLEETNKGGKNIIRRKKESRSTASLIEVTMDALQSNDPNYIQTAEGITKEDKQFNVALELCITWLNRILFLKLMEGQLVNYHEGNLEYKFLNSEKIFDYDELFTLFHNVLALKIADRKEAVKEKYSKVPYLNSSLFDISPLERETIKISALDNRLQLDLINTTILKDSKKKVASLPTLDYLFQFLDAYDFASEGTDDIREDKKDLINASVLGKIFEKINGYKDGSIFTPAFITMYMCKQSLRLAVVQKFNEALSENAESKFDTFDDVKNHTSRQVKATDILKSNQIINSLRICDPAVGSGHFLVSALNEIISIKADLGILADDKGSSIGNYEIEIIDDELFITDPKNNDHQFEYTIQNGKPKTKEIQRLQKTLFYEKQTIIENCLFGVDINPNSVKICSLRLWIELLKNAYYKEDTNYLELETLPNIDINIKCGNSLLSRFGLKEDLSDTLKSIKYTFDNYRGFVSDYKNATDKEEKRGLLKIIADIKDTISSQFFQNSKENKTLARTRGEYQALMFNRVDLFGNKLKGKSFELQKERLEQLMERDAKIIADIKSNKLFKNAFEWRFEFPEVLNNNGEFEGFDLIIGNPPYIKEYENKSAFNGLRDLECYQGKMDIWYLFGDLGLKLLKPNYNLCYIATNNWTTNAGASKFRNIVIKNSQIVNLTDFGAYMIFENASIQTMIMMFKNNSVADNYTFDYRKLGGNKPTLENVLNILEGTQSEYAHLLSPTVSKLSLINKSLTFNTDENSIVLDKIKAKHNFILDPKKEIAQGIVPNPDIVNNSNITKIPKERIAKENIKVGDGVFIVNRGYFDKISAKERKYVKPIYEPYLIDKYLLLDYDKEIIYITKKNYKDDAPELISHLEKYKEIMENRRENLQGKLGFNNLHWPRDDYFFEKGAKILSVRKCATPTFTYTEEETYVMMSFNVIRSNNINLKYLTGLLNSKLIAFWLRKKGKMQGNNYQLDKEPLLEIPIFKPTEAESNKIASLVEKIILQKQQGEETTTNEKNIDELVYKLYELTEEEIKIIEEN